MLTGRIQTSRRLPVVPGAPASALHVGGPLSGTRLGLARRQDPWCTADMLAMDPQPPNRAKNRIPEIEGYRINRFINAGSMGSVYEAVSLANAEVVAIKLCKAASGAGEEMSGVKAFQNEVQIASLLHHSSIVRVFGADVMGQRPYIIMEYVPHGRTLRRHCREVSSRLPVATVVDVVRRCAHALHYAHSLGVVHRDIKPANILLRYDGIPKIGDFSISVFSDPVSSITKVSRVGSPLYMAPEQVREDETTPSTDVYSLGVVLYELLVSKPPFNGSTMSEVARKILYELPTPVADIRPDLPRELIHVVTRSLQKHPTKRYRSAMDMYADLDLVLESLIKIPPEPIAAVG